MEPKLDLKHARQQNNPRSDNKQADDDSDRNFLTDRVLV
jgi:hypothetical protein